MFRVNDINPLIASEIQADKETLLSGEKAQDIRAILEQRGVIAFRRLNLTDEEHCRFSETLGEVITNTTGADETGIGKISMDKEKYGQVAEYQRGAVHWHIDGTMDEIPTRASIMNAIKIAEEGGQTEFANTYAAWDELPANRKAELEDLKVVHELEVIQRLVYPEPTEEQVTGWRKYPTKTHPLVWTHQSGRKSLVLGGTASHIEGMDKDKGRALLAELQDWAAQPQFVYRHEWTPGDLVIWDNTGTMHRVLPYDINSGRLMHRITLKGEERLV